MKDGVKKLRERVYEATFKPGYCIERAYWMTKSYMETEGEPIIIRRAKALKKILENMTIGIEDGELIVGKPTSKLVSSPLFPEIDWRYLENLIESDYLTEDEKVKLKEVISYWKGKSFSEMVFLRLPNEFKTEAIEFILDASRRSHIAHCAPNYDKVLKEGLNAIKKRVENEIMEMKLEKTENVKKIAFLEAVKISLEAVIAFARRYADLAKKLMESESDIERKAELMKIAKICEWVPANPARTFHEALQAIWFIYIALAMEGLGAGIGFGRIDQYLYPFYKKDIEEGRLTKEHARELLALFLIKINELAFHFPGTPPHTIKQYRSGSEQTLSSITIGGVTRDGLDATNELSYLLLEAEMDVGLLEDIVVRVHKDTPYPFLMKACEVAKLLKGKIKFVSDETVIRQLIEDGKSLEDARDYAVMGCFIRTVPGRSFDPPAIGGGVVINLPMALELALNNGVSRLTGKQIGPKTGDPKKFKSYDELWLAYKKQVEFIIHKAVTFSNSIFPLYSEFIPYPLMSALFDGCISSGKDITEGGAVYNTQNFWVCGIVNVGDSLAAIKKVVFEDKKISMDTLIEALNKNFEGYEDVLNLLRAAPKFGNDDDYVDLIVNNVLT
ncbi:MAG: pyruvate formate lyase family protein, partial [Candidatus Bathyarchaeia archaeon]